MTRPHRSRPAIALACAAVLTGPGCTATGDAQRTTLGQAELVWQSAHCGVWHEGVRLVDGPAALRAVLERARPAQAGESAPDLARVDFGRRLALRVALGRQATAGYAVGPGDAPVTIVDGSARLTVAVQEPSPDSMQAQVVTDPCAVLALPRGDYERIVVRDGTGEVLGRVRVRRVESD